MFSTSHRKYRDEERKQFVDFDHQNVNYLQLATSFNTSITRVSKYDFSRAYNFTHFRFNPPL